MRSVLVACGFLALVLIARMGHAEVMVGGMGAPEGTTHPLSLFNSLAQGQMAPYRQIAGPSIQIREGRFGSYEPNQQLIYISDFRGQAVRVFPAFASGDVAPIRVLDSPRIGNTLANAPVFEHGELGVIEHGCCVATYPLDASGSMVTSIRELASGSTGIRNPSVLLYIPATDEYAVLDNEPPPSYASRIVFHNRTSSGNVLPSRLISGAGVADARGMAYDPATRRIFVLREEAAPPDADRPGIISVFDDLASGEVWPMYEITSSDLFVPPGNQFAGLGFDPYTNRLMVSSTRYGGTPDHNRLVALQADAIGNVPAIQILSGSNLSSYNVSVPFAVPLAPPGPMPLLAIAHPTVVRYGETSALSSLGGVGTGALTYSVSAGAGACSIVGQTLTAIDTGNCTVTVTKAASFSHPEQTASVNLTVDRTDQAPLLATATPATLVPGATSTLASEGGSGTGAVTFHVQHGTAFCSIQGNTLAALQPGTCIVRARKDGDSHYFPAASPELPVTVVAGEAVFGDGFENSPPAR